MHELEIEPSSEPEFLSEQKPVRESVRVKRAPDAAAVGSGGLRNAGKVVVIFYEELRDYKRKTEQIAGAGDYFAEYCIDGRTQKTWAFRIDVAAAPPHAFAPPMQYAAPAIPSGIDARLDRVERLMLSRFEESRPRNKPRSFNRRRDERANNDFLREIMERDRQQAREIMEREREHNREMSGRDRASYQQTIEHLKAQQSPAPQMSKKALLFETLTEETNLVEDLLGSVIDRIQDGGKEEPWYSDITRTAVQVVAPPLGSLVGSFAQRLVAPLVNNQKTDAAQPQPVAGVQAHAPTPQPTHNSQQQSPLSDEAQAAFAQMLAVVVQDMTANAPAERSVEAVLALCAKHPEVRMAVDPLLSQPAPAVVATLAQIGGAPVAQACAVPHARAFIEKLQAGINARRLPAQEKPSAVAVSNNGARAAQSS